MEHIVLAGQPDFKQDGLMRYKNLKIFSVFWLIAFIIYYPAAKAGFVGDFPYDINNLRRESLLQFLDIKGSSTLYLSANLDLFLLFKLFGTHPWAWHIVHVTLHAFNGLLLFKLFSGLLRDSGIKDPKLLSFIAVCLFIICPQASEPVVWEPANHYLVVSAIIFLVLVYVRKFYDTQKKWYAWLASLLFFYAIFSQEFFYLAPWLVLLLISYYHFVLHYDKAISHKAFFYFFIPLLSLFILHLLLLRIFKHTFISHYGKLNRMPLSYYLSKPIKYIFHVIFLGRYFSQDIRSKVYDLCETKKAITVFYSAVICFGGYVLLRFKRVSIKLKLMALLSAYNLLVYAFLSPLIFPDTGLVYLDRYTYIVSGFSYLLLVVAASCINFRLIKAALLVGYGILNLWFTIKVNHYWKQSAVIIAHLLNIFPDPGSKIVLLLNLPDDLKGIPMIAAEDDGRFRTMKNALSDHPVSNLMYDVAAYNMSAIGDGAHVNIVNDSVIHVTLNQWGTWWLYGMEGATSYSNKDYTLNMVDEGHWYELTLKHPAGQYLLLYQVGDKWKSVDWSKKNVDQD